MRTMALRAALVLVTALASMSALAQPALRVHGTIESVNGSTLVIKRGDGADVTVRLADNARVIGVKPATLAEVKPGDFIAVGAMPQPDGSLKAIRGRSWPNSNAASARVLSRGIAPARR